MSGKLYVVGTPIGNLGDFSPRAAETLRKVDFIAAEDTRVTLKLLNHFEIKKEMLSYFEHNKNERGELIIKRILAGESCAVVTDAGMPAISDPGEQLVRSAHESGITVESVPGPSAVVTALAISGMSSSRFCFEGFLPVDRAERRSRLDELKTERRTMVFYEAPHKLAATLKALLEAFGDRELALTREITKLHETVTRTTIEAALKTLENEPARGEYVLIVAGVAESTGPEYTEEQAVQLARELAEGGLSASAAAKEAAAVTGIKKNEIYRRLNF